MRKRTQELSVEQLIESASGKRLMAVTGAGVSVLSGIPDFQAVDESSWNEKISREEILSKTFFWSQPELFWNLYKKLFFSKGTAALQPSAAHLFLKKLESVSDVTIYTQNVDGLHQAAGNKKVVEVHGNSRHLICTKCGEYYNTVSYLDQKVPYCPTDEARLKPNVLLYGENSRTFEHLFAAIGGADILLVMGTSLTVTPVSNVPIAAKIFHPRISRVYWDKNAHKHAEIFTKIVRTDFSEL